MRIAALLALFTLLANAQASADEAKSFREQQLQFSRVRTSAREKDEVVRGKLKDKGLSYPPRAILLRAFKKEGALELWARDDGHAAFALVWTYKICATSGVLGPKRRFGDEQVPEGFYLLDWFNPQSNFFLSLHVSYPNGADSILGSHENPGGDIFLHGNCVTIGCLPIMDDGIKEVYWAAVLARTAGQRNIPIHIFPARLTEDGLRALATSHRGQPGLIAFWDNLKEGIDYFEKKRMQPKITVSPAGVYRFADVHAD